MPELEEIKILRRKLGITQSDLAKLANVSQSFIAKLEARLIEPSYTKTKKLFEVLASFKEEKEPKAEQLMIKKIISLKPNDKVDSAIKLMRKHAISQVPVVERSNVVGIISEATIINNIGKDIASNGRDSADNIQKFINDACQRSAEALSDHSCC
ncbi:CBS domain-containing protein [Candidatus Woesearchaeota archaeon]|nr:CBS domain-containing protein [Candidatus Woesearchaeota archaeon]